MTEHSHPRRTKSETIASTVVAVLLAAAFGFFGASKLAADPTQVAMFEGWGYPLWFMYAVGATEVAAAGLLLVPRTRFHAAATVVALMIGGAITHASAGQWMQLPLPLMTGAAAGLLAVLHRPSWLAAGLGGEPVDTGGVA